MRLRYLISVWLCCSMLNLATAQCPAGTLLLSTQTAIDNFSTDYPGCTMMPGALVIIDDNDGLDDITNLNALLVLSSITGNFGIDGNPALTDISGLSALTSVGGILFIGNNALLADINGLSTLNSAGGPIGIQNNTVLTNIDGLSGLSTVSGDFFIGANPALLHVNGLSGITSIGGILFIDDNVMLMNLNGLSALTSIGGNFGVQNNSSLSLCCNLCPLLAADIADPAVIGGIIAIADNATGCNSEAEINACSPCAIAAVPTLGQWGLILLALLFLNLGLISILQSRYRLAGVPGTYFQNLPVVTGVVLADRKAFLQQYLIAGLFITTLFAISIFFFSYELMPFDVPGSILAASLLAFLMRMLDVRKET